MRTNGLSAFGRMTYAAHLGLYPVVGGFAYFVLTNYQSYSAARTAKEELEALPALKSVDPDNFQPFSAIPFHNNPELRYRYADMKMWNYLNKENHMNLKDYFFKGFNNSFDHDSQSAHLYNWVNMTPADSAKIGKPMTA